MSIWFMLCALCTLYFCR